MVAKIPGNGIDIDSGSPIEGATNNGGAIALKRPNTTVTAGQTLGEIGFVTADSGSAGVAARIIGEGDGTGGEGRISFYTGTGGSTTRRWHIDSTGNLFQKQRH